MQLQKEVLYYFQEMKQFFIKKGKKEKTENAFRSYLWFRAKAKKSRFLVTLSKAMLNSTPFIRLRAKKRRRYTKYKIQPVEKDWARRKALGAFSKSYKEHSSSAKDFFTGLDKEIELLQSGKSSIQVKRDEYHRTALKAAPYRWRYLLKQKEYFERKAKAEKQRKEKGQQAQQQAFQANHVQLKKNSKKSEKVKNPQSKLNKPEFKLEKTKYSAPLRAKSKSTSKTK